MKNKKKGKNMNTYNEIKEVESKITNLDSFIDKNNDLNLQGEKLAKVSDAIESVIFNQEKLKQLKLKLEKEKNLTKKINALNLLNIEVVSRERDSEHWSYKFTNGFYPEKIEIMLKNKVVPLTYMYDNFYISYKDSGGQALFNLFEDKVKDEHLFYTKERT